jgi:hypothetical protein
MDEAPSRIEMVRTVERNRRQLSMRSSRTANESGTIHIGNRVDPTKGHPPGMKNFLPRVRQQRQFVDDHYH